MINQHEDCLYLVKAIPRSELRNKTYLTLIRLESSTANWIQVKIQDLRRVNRLKEIQVHHILLYNLHSLNCFWKLRMAKIKLRLWSSLRSHRNMLNMVKLLWKNSQQMAKFSSGPGMSTASTLESTTNICKPSWKKLNQTYLAYKK